MRRRVDALSEGGPDLRVDDFDYDLPPELIAHHPPPERDDGRLMVVDREAGAVHHARVRDLPQLLAPGDLLVANNSRVIPARLFARKADTGGRVELLLLRETASGRWQALARPVRRLSSGSTLVIDPRSEASGPEVRVEVATIADGGEVGLRVPDDFRRRLVDLGRLPLPPYIEETLDDEERYQTVYGSNDGSAAAPTAGLHFTPRLIERLTHRGVGWAEVTLHVGLDTFRPMTSEFVRDHVLHREWCEVPASSAKAIAATKRRAGRVVAVGTTAARTLETFGPFDATDDESSLATATDLFIVPGYRWRVVDALITNFHLPRSTLLMMIASLMGMDLWRAAYHEAIAQRYRFYSFGDAMLIL